MIYYFSENELLHIAQIETQFVKSYALISSNA